MQSAPRLSLKERQRQEREALLLQVAEDVFVEKGYRETSMDEIAARVGIAKGTVYLHFPSKEDLIIAIFERSMQTFIESIDEIIAAPPTNRAKLEAILHFMYTGFFSKRAQLLGDIINSSDLHRLLMEKSSYMQDWRDRFTKTLTGLIDAGKAAGEFSTAIPTIVLANTFFSLISPRIYQRLMRDEGMSAEDLVRYVGHIYFSGISNQ